MLGFLSRRAPVPPHASSAAEHGGSLQAPSWAQAQPAVPGSWDRQERGSAIDQGTVPSPRGWSSQLPSASASAWLCSLGDTGAEQGWGGVLPALPEPSLAQGTEWWPLCSREQAEVNKLRLLSCFAASPLHSASSLQATLLGVQSLGMLPHPL